MRMVRWMCGVKLQDRVPSKELRERSSMQIAGLGTRGTGTCGTGTAGLGYAGLGQRDWDMRDWDRHYRDSLYSVKMGKIVTCL